MSIELIFWDFLSGTYQLDNFSANDIIAQSDTLPPGMIGKMVDSSIVFTTSGGQVGLQVKKASGGVVRFTDGFSSTATGLQGFSISPGDKLQIILIATGSGVIDVNIHGEVKQNFNTRRIQEARMAQDLQFLRDGL